MSITGALQPPEFTEQALCAQTDPERFFPDKGSSSRPAKNVCLRCEARVECLQWALSTGQKWGVWGGKSARERRKMKSDRPPQSAV